MIQDYEIRKRNNEEVLYLYFNFDYEFAKLNVKKKKKHLKQEIERFIKENKIDFAGKTIAIVAGGLLIGTILINNSPKIDVPLIEPQSIAIVTDFNEQNIINDNIINEEVKPEVKEEIKETKEVKENKTVSSNKNTNSVKNNTTIKNNVKESSKVESTKEIEEVVDNNVYVTVYRRNGSILKIELEEYVIGVVGAEMPAAFNIEALKSQAILARTYALKALENNIQLTDTSSTQNYKDNSELKKLWGSSYTTYYNKIQKAVEGTKGQYLTYNGKIIEAVYHSTSNGQTENAKNVWGNEFPYLVSVESPYDSENKSFISETTFSYEVLSQKLNVEVNKDTVINILSKTEGNRVDKIEINNKIFTGVEVRNLLGLRSADFTIEMQDNGIKITNKGYGHGVGMSQYGANGIAKRGKTYKQILMHYYPNTLLVNM